MGQWLAVASKRTELDFASRADGSMRMSYLDKVRSISLVSWSAGSSSYCSTTITNSTGSIGSHVSYSGGASCSSTAAGSSIVPTTTREVACLMVKDGYIRVLIRMFGREPGVLERWFSELGVDWVLRINSKDHGRSSQLEGADDDHLVRNLVPRWTRALALMVEALTTATDVVVRQRHPAGSVLLQEEISDADATTTGSDHEPDGLRLARFAEAAISKMLAFVDALVVVVGANHRCRTEKLQALINVLACVSGALETLMPLLEYHSGCVALPEEMRSLVMKIDGVFSRRMYELNDAVTSMISDARDVILRGDSWETIPRNGEIHEATWLCADYVNLSWAYAYQSALNSIVKGFFMYERDTILLMIPKLENQLEEKSQLIPDRSLRYIFLLNNSHFIEQMLESVDISDRFPFGPLFDPSHKVESYLESYLDVSWEPVLSCLHNETPLCFPKHSSLAKFDWEFQRACSAQKLWKVPNPGLRKRLRTAIVGKVVTGYNNFLGERPGKEEDCSGDPTSSSSQDLEDMLNELFEG